jgi:Protein of unknown function (DUF2905)
MMGLGRMLIGLGLVLVIAGAIISFLPRLPGDFVFRGKNTTFYFPLGTSILISVILSLILWLLNKRP